MQKAIGTLAKEAFGYGKPCSARRKKEGWKRTCDRGTTVMSDTQIREGSPPYTGKRVMGLIWVEGTEREGSAARKGKHIGKSEDISGKAKSSEGGG